jgi:hypothetical protein
MMKIFLARAKPRRTVLVVSAIAPVCLGLLLGFGGTSRQQSASNSEIKIVNKTTTLEVVAFRTPDGGRLIVRFKNISSKELNGYAVAVNGGRITGDISSGDRVVSPGQTEDLEIPLSPTPPELTVMAAMFADGTIDGEPTTVGELRKWRLALKKQLTRSVTFLDAILESPDVDTAKALDRLKSQFSSLDPDSTTESRIAGDTLNTELQTLREKRDQEPLKQRQHLFELKARIERRIANL